MSLLLGNFYFRVRRMQLPRPWLEGFLGKGIDAELIGLFKKTFAAWTFEVNRCQDF